MEGQIATFLKSHSYWEFDKGYNKESEYPETVIVDSVAMGLQRSFRQELGCYFRLERDFPLVNSDGNVPYDSYARFLESTVEKSNGNGGIFPFFVIHPTMTTMKFIHPHPFINSVETRHVVDDDNLCHFFGGASLVFYENDLIADAVTVALESVKLTPTKFEFQSRSNYSLDLGRYAACFIGFGKELADDQIDFLPRDANIVLGDWETLPNGLLSKTLQNVTITYDPTHQIYGVSISLTQRNMDDFVRVFRKYLYAGTKTLVTSKRNGGIMSLEFLQKYCTIANKIIQSTFDTPQEYFSLNYDQEEGTADIMVSLVGLKEKTFMEDTVSIPFPLKKLTRVLYEKILREIRELEQINFRQRTKEQLARLTHLIETAMYFQDVSYMDCHMCSANVGSHILNDAHILCTTCAKLVQKPLI